MYVGLMERFLLIYRNRVFPESEYTWRGRRKRTITRDSLRTRIHRMLIEPCPWHSKWIDSLCLGTKTITQSKSILKNLNTFPSLQFPLSPIHCVNMKLHHFCRSNNFLAVGLTLVFLGLILPSWRAEAVGIQRRRSLSHKKVSKVGKSKPVQPISSSCDFHCNNTEKSNVPDLGEIGTTTFPILVSITEEPFAYGTSSSIGDVDIPTTTMSLADSYDTLVKPEKSHFQTPSESSGIIHFDELTKILKFKRRDCKKMGRSVGNKDRQSFTCEKLKLSSWLLHQLEKNSTDILSSYVRLTRSSNLSEITHETELLPESWPEKVVYRMISKFGEPVDKLLFYQFKKYTKSRQLYVEIPHLLQLQLSPRTHSEVSTGRTLFDPGFNLKLKLPFFQDELSKFSLI